MGKWVLKIKGIISSTIFILFIAVTLTGIGLYFAPSGRIARDMRWTFLGFSREALKDIHNVTGFAMCGVIILHLVLNYRLITLEIKYQELFREIQASRLIILIVLRNTGFIKFFSVL